MMTIENKRRLMRIGVFLIPVVLVKGASFFSSAASPTGAEAAQALAPVPETPVDAASNDAISQERRDAAVKIAALYKQPFGETPLYFDIREPAPGDNQAVKIDPGAPALIVQAILASSSGGGRDTALINNKMYKVGDEFEKSGWFITAIDNKSRAVTLKDSKSDREVTVNVRMNE